MFLLHVHMFGCVSMGILLICFLTIMKIYENIKMFIVISRVNKPVKLEHDCSNIKIQADGQSDMLL